MTVNFKRTTNVDAEKETNWKQRTCVCVCGSGCSWTIEVIKHTHTHTLVCDKRCAFMASFLSSAAHLGFHRVLIHSRPRACTTQLGSGLDRGGSGVAAKVWVFTEASPLRRRQLWDERRRRVPGGKVVGRKNGADRSRRSEGRGGDGK